MKAKKIMFTDDELRTLVWAISDQYHGTVRQNLKNGKSRESDTTKRLTEISKKVYGELINRHN